MIIHTNEVMYIPKGSINQIITHLQEKKYPVSKLDSFIVRFIGAPQNGWIYMQERRLRRGDFLYRLTTAKAALREITLIPGETTANFLDILAKRLRCDRKLLEHAYEKYAKYPEGMFVPDTYKIPLGISEEDLMRLLLSTAQKRFRRFSYKVFGTYNELKWLRYLVVASIIQKEAASKEEMPLIASVIYNRLRRGMKLQMDGTLNYGKYSHQKITPKRLREDTSRYNTYKYAGLPPYPVCNSGFDAIKAAIFPAKTPYLYFVKLRNGRHSFSVSFQNHRKKIKSVTKSIK